MISTRVRLPIAISMKFAGRKIELSIVIPVRPGRIAASASSTPSRHVQGVGAGEFLDHQQQARAIVCERVANQRLMIFHHVGHIAQAQRRVLDRHLRQTLRP